MTQKFSKLFLAAGLSAILGTATISAQSSYEVANVPFAFHTAGQTLTAGRYTVSPASQSPGVFRLGSPEGRSVFVSMRPGSKSDPNNPKLTFACYGGECVLAKVALPGRSESWEQPQSQIEKNLTHKLGVAAMIAVPLRAR